MLNVSDFQSLLGKVRLLIPAESDDGQASAMLASIQESYAEVLAAHDEQINQIAGLSERNESLRKFNEELFFRQGQKVEKTQDPEVEQTDPKIDESEVLGAYA